MTAAPAWVRDAFFYQIFPDRFARSAGAPPLPGLEPWDAPATPRGKKGGDLLGIVERLDWLTDLGVTALYLNPIFVSPANHRYHVSDYFHVDPVLGGDAAFDRLLAACHARGLRVVLDGVFNHSGRGFFAFVDLVENGETSLYRDWFSVRSSPIRPYGPGDHGYAAWCDNPALPKLATDNPDVREYLMRVAEHWVERGIDGWRLDTPEQIETPGFWQEFRERTKKKNPELYLVGEVWTDARSWVGDAQRFDGVLNYYLGGRTLAFVGRESLDLGVCQDIDYPLKRTLDAREMASFAAELATRLPDDALLSSLNLDSSHDTPRLVTLLSGDRERVHLAKLLQFGFPGAPCILYGDEIGLAGAGDPACRAAFPWDAPERHDREVHALIRDLGRLRRDHPALRRGSVTILDTGAEVFGYLRELREDRVLVAVNPGARTVRVPLPLAAGRVERALGSGQLTPTGGDLVLELPAKSGGIWALAG